MSDVIELRGLRLEAIVGVLAEERERPQPIEVDLDLERSFAAAAAHDDLGATTNYAEVLTLVERVIHEGRFLLLETLAHRVADAALGFDLAIDAVTVRVRKTRPPVPQAIDSVGVACRVARR